MLAYSPRADLKEKPSELQILRNFENAVTKLGGTVVTATKAKETLRIVAVLQALVRTHGIAVVRLRSFGAGPLSQR